MDEATACANYAAQMCATLGPRTSSCEAVQRVGQWMAPSACVVAIQDMDVTTARIAGLRSACDDVGKKLCAKPEVNEEVCQGLTADLTMVPPEDCSSLLQAFPEVEEAFMERLAAEQPLSAELMGELIAGAPPAFGPADAPVKLVLFSDFQCPYCARVTPTIERLREDFPQQVHLVFRQFPLSFHENAHGAAEAALAAHAQGKFWPFHDLLFANQQSLSEADLEKYAKEVGLNLKTFKKALSDDTYEAAVDADIALGQRARVQGTPTLILNGKPVENPLDADAVAAAVQQALAAQAPAQAAPEPAPPAAGPPPAAAPAAQPAQVAP